MGERDGSRSSETPEISLRRSIKKEKGSLVKDFGPVVDDRVVTMTLEQVSIRSVEPVETITDHTNHLLR